MRSLSKLHHSQEDQIEMWVPDSAAKTLVDSISDIIKHKPHLIGADVREKLEELKAQLQELRLLMPNFFDEEWHSRKRRPLVPNSRRTRNQYTSMRSLERPTDQINLGRVERAIGEVLQGCEDAVDFVYSCCSCRRSMLSRMFVSDTESRRYQIGKAKTQIGKACDQVRHINEEIMDNGFDRVLHSSRDQAIINLDPPLNSSTVHNVGEKRVIGFDEAAAEVVGLLTTGAETLKVISIVGKLSGMGKTTLATMVYNDHEVQSQYQIRAFLHVLKEFNRREVLLKLLNAFAHERVLTEKMDEERLQKHVRQQLTGKQYLIVLDEIWEKNDWKRLQDAFPEEGNKRCRVLITTRKDEVAELARRPFLSFERRGNPESIYWIPFLSLESSKELLRWLVFGNNHCPVKLREYEKDLVIKCNGLPLALLSVAAMITKHRDKVEWWETVANNTRKDFWKEGDLNLYLAYVNLPNHLKPCFLYLSVFHPETEIPVWRLLRLWIAEGFIVEEEGDSRGLEDIAEQYLEELVDRHFLMVSKRRSNGRMGTCKLNSTFHDFCSSQAECENLFIYDSNTHRSDLTFLGECRRTCFREYLLNGGNRTAGKSIRSLFGSNFELDQTTVSFIPKRFKLLKVLEVGFPYYALPDQFWSLVLLKYLSISGGIVSIPSTLSDLWSLQTLIVDTTSPTLEIQADIWIMPHFRHLHTNAPATFSCKSPKTEHGGSNFRTLCYISLECCKREAFSRTTKLRKLGIRGKLGKMLEANQESSLIEYLRKLEYLENLKLLNCNSSPAMPSNITFPKQLTKITLSNTRLNWKEMRTLGELEKLEVLKLKEYAIVGEQWKTEIGGFLRLRQLHIGHTNLIVWEASADHFPQLRSLKINECNQLRHIPRGMADIQSLQSVHIHGSTSPGVAYSLKRIRLVKFLQTGSKNFEISILK